MLGDEFVFGGGFVVVEPGDEFVKLSITIVEFRSNIFESRSNIPHDAIELVIELSRSICRDMLMMVCLEMIDVLGVGMLDNRSSGISSTDIR